MITITANRAEAFNLPFQIKNEFGGVIDITSLDVTFNLKESSASISVLLTKVSTDPDQIGKLLPTAGIGIVKILAINTATYGNRNYFYEITCTGGTQQGFIKFKNNFDVTLTNIPIHGTTAEMNALALVLTSSDRVYFYNDEDLSAYFWSGSAWT